MEKRQKEFKKIHNFTKKFALLIPGEGEALYDYARKTPNKGVVLEIGTFKGASTIWLAKGSKSKKREKVYTIDPHSGKGFKKKNTKLLGVYIPSKSSYNPFLRNLRKANVDDYVVPIKEDSHKIAKTWNKPIRLLFIDGGHGYADVKKDFLLWEPFLVKGGVIAFHDSAGLYSKYVPWPKKVVKEDILNSKRFEDIKIIQSITFAKKIKYADKKEQLKNKLISKFIKIKFILNLIEEFSFRLLERAKKIQKNLKKRLTSFYKSLDRFIGKIGILIKKHDEDLYNKLKKIKGK